MSKKVTYIVTVELPDDESFNSFRSYMREAIESWSGQFHPDDSLFGWFYKGRKLTIKSAGKTQ